jgi:hypothetical protein
MKTVTVSKQREEGEERGESQDKVKQEQIDQDIQRHERRERGRGDHPACAASGQVS